MTNADTINTIINAIQRMASQFSVVRVTLFGSRANGTHREDSDVDLIFEFNAPVSLITIGIIKEYLENLIHLEVDIIHGPIQSTDMIEIGRSIELYAA